MIFGLVGYPQSGKDTIAKHLVKRHGFVQYAFADPIRAMLQVGLGIKINDFTDKNEPVPSYNKSRRVMMQTLGTEWGRDIIHPDIWVIAARGWLTGQRSVPHEDMVPDIVFSDVRFANEFNFVKSEGGIIIRVRRLNEQTYDHESEAWKPTAEQIDYELHNNQSIRSLTQEVDAIVIQNEPLKPVWEREQA